MVQNKGETTTTQNGKAKYWRDFCKKKRHMICARNYMKSPILLDKTFSDEFFKEFSLRRLWISNLLINGIQFLSHYVKK